MITMSTERIRKKRRRRFRKPKPLIVILSSITILLLFVWGGLYWKESSEKALIDNTNGNESSQQTQEENEGQSTVTEGPLDMDIEVNSEENPSTIMDDELTAGAPDPSTSLGETGVDRTITKPAEQVKTKADSPEHIKTPLQTPSQPSSSSQQKNTRQQQTTTQQQPSSQPTSDYTSQVESESSSSKETTDGVTIVQKYEQEMIQLETSCRNDINNALNKANTSFQKLNKGNIADVQTWKENLNIEITTAESTCEATYQDLIRAAEKDDVPIHVIEEWSQTYNALKVRLQDESKAKIQQLM